MLDPSRQPPRWLPIDRPRRPCSWLHCALLALPVSVGLLPLPAAAQVRPEVLLLVDNSGSMRRTPLSQKVGNDCMGPNPIDRCGDGLCSGAETVSSCAADCAVTADTTLQPGSTVKCGFALKSASRLAMVKRALRNILPDLRAISRLALAAFKHTANGAAAEEYYQYHVAASSGATRWVTLLLTEWELRAEGSWTGGEPWDPVNGPKPSFAAHGTTYRLLSAPLVQADANITEDADSLYRRADAQGYTYARFRYADAGYFYDDGSHTWTYVGSYYSYRAEAPTAGTTPFVAFKGPRFSEGGQTYIYRRYDGAWGNHGLVFHEEGKLYVPFIAAAAQGPHDDQVARILTWVNMAGAGGFYGVANSKGTPTGEAMQMVRQYFEARAPGDVYSHCRKRFVILLSDGESTGIDPIPEADALFDVDLDNRIKTFVVAVPGTPQSAMNELDGIAAAGGTVAAIASDNEKELVQALRQAIQEGGGDVINNCAPIYPDAGPDQGAPDGGPPDAALDLAGDHSADAAAEADAGVDQAHDAPLFDLPAADAAAGDGGWTDGGDAAAADLADDDADSDSADPQGDGGPGDSGDPQGEGGVGDGAGPLDDASAADGGDGPTPQTDGGVTTDGAAEDGGAAAEGGAGDGDVDLSVGGEGGCDCATADGVATPPWWLLALLGLLLLGRARRR